MARFKVRGIVLALAIALLPQAGYAKGSNLEDNCKYMQDKLSWTPDNSNVDSQATERGQQGILQCGPGQIRVRRMNANGQREIRCVDLNACGGSASTRLCVDVDEGSGNTRGFKAFKCMRCNGTVNGDKCEV